MIIEVRITIIVVIYQLPNPIASTTALPASSTTASGKLMQKFSDRSMEIMTDRPSDATDRPVRQPSDQSKQTETDILQIR